jgi:glucose 1-dehydrogenase
VTSDTGVGLQKGALQMRLDGRVGVVTGASGGMGRAIVETLLAAGASVVATDLSLERLGELQSGVDPQRLTVMAGDVSLEADVAGVVDLAVTTYGRLDMAVNAAAIEFERVPLHELSTPDYERMMAVNARSVFLSMKYELAAMLASSPMVGRERHRGSIVNIASTNSFIPQNHQAAYTASKHAVLGLTRSAALDYARKGIRVNAICPGAIDTPMLRDAMARRGRSPEEVASRLSPLGRFGEPDEIAQAALWLCSDSSSYTTGHALAVDGGMLSS